MSDLFNRIQQALEGRYEIECEIGRGGMGIVYLATDLKLKRQVAIKVLRPELAQAVGAERFLREVRIEASLDHPNIVALFDSGEADGLPYYVMPYVKGESLRKLIEREERLSLDDVVRITNAVAAGLSHAHANGVIHRDIKPENILLADDRVLVADFGIAKATEEAGGEKLSTYGLVLGTPEYMSPEQAMDDKVDHRTDIYALGCVVYEMLSGDPPFTGRTRSAIIAKQVQERVPSLTVVRADAPLGVVEAVQKALAKVAADRFGSAMDFAEAVERRDSGKQKGWRMVGSFAAVLAIAAIGLWSVARPPDIALNSNRIVGFPMEETAIAGLSAGIGEVIALGIGSALEETAPLEWVDGWKYLDEEQRADIATLDNRARNRIAKQRGARYIIDGSVVTTQSAASVILWLYDVESDSPLDRRTVTGIAADSSVMRSAVEATRELMATVLRPGRDIERIPLEDQDFAAVVLWMEGKREYRSSRFGSALDFYKRALQRDSTLAMSALNAAQAASWESRLEEAEEYAAIALRYSASLPLLHRHLARGLYGYLTGEADSAAYWLRRALAADGDWAEAHMALGEVYYHLLPVVDEPLESLAETEFEAALSDPSFSPPLYHLTEITIRRGNVSRAEDLFERYRAFAPADWIVQRLGFMLTCVRDGATRMRWAEAVRMSSREAFGAAKALAVGGYQAACAERGFKAILADDSSESRHWGAVQGLQGLWIATGDRESAVAIVDSVVNTGQPPAVTVLLLDAIADGELQWKGLEVEEFLKSTFGDRYERSPSPHLSWFVGSWHAHRGDLEMVGSLVGDLRVIAESGDRQARLFADALEAQLSLMRGDTARAIDEMKGLGSTARRGSVEWFAGESLPTTRLALAELLLARGRYEEVLNVASVFDHQSPVAFYPFVARSLVLRYRAARRLNRTRLEEEFRDRLEMLGRLDLMVGGN